MTTNPTQAYASIELGSLVVKLARSLHLSSGISLRLTFMKQESGLRTTVIPNELSFLGIDAYPYVWQLALPSLLFEVIRLIWSIGVIFGQLMITPQ